MDHSQSIFGPRKIDPTAAPDNDDALSDYVARIHELGRLASAIADYCDDMGGVGPDEVRWSDVSTVHYALGRVKLAADFLGIKLGKE